MIKDNIITAISSFLTSEDLELYDLNIAGNEAISKIEIFIDSNEDLSLSIFERLNYQIQRLIEELGIEKGSYELVLSSPGIERSLKTKRHFELALNEEIKIKLLTPHDGEYSFIGILKEVNSKEIKILIDKKSINFELDNIKKANISFDKFKVKVNSWGNYAIRKRYKTSNRIVGSW